MELEGGDRAKVYSITVELKARAASRARPAGIQDDADGLANILLLPTIARFACARVHLQGNFRPRPKNSLPFTCFHSFPQPAPCGVPSHSVDIDHRGP